MKKKLNLYLFSVAKAPLEPAHVKDKVKMKKFQNKRFLLDLQKKLILLETVH